MKILMIQDTDWIKRNPIQHNHILERMVLKGHEVRVIDYDILWKGEKSTKLLSKRQIFSVSRIMKNAEHSIIRPTIIRLPILDYVSMLFTYRVEIQRQIVEFKPDIIYMDTILTAYLASNISKKKKIRTIYYCIDICYRLIPYKFLQPLGKLIEKKNIQKADRVISINQKLCEYTIRMGAKKQNTAVIRAGVDCSRFNPAIDGSKMRIRYGIKKIDKVICFVGWLYHFSGLKEVAEELSRLNKPDLKLFIIGDGDAFEPLQRLRQTYHLEEKMIMVGKQSYETLPELMAVADIFILPAYDNEIMRDIVPIKMYEYMAMGRPVVSTKLSGIMTEFGNGNGIVYVDKPKDVLSHAIGLFDKGQDKGLGKIARNFVEKYSWETITDKFEQLVQEVVTNHG